jgi:hypothetical protein
VDVKHAPLPNWTAVAHRRGTCNLPSPIIPVGGFGGGSFPPWFHPGFTPIFESEGLTIRPLLRGDLLPSKQVVAGSIPVSRSSPH